MAELDGKVQRENEIAIVQDVPIGIQTRAGSMPADSPAESAELITTSNAANVEAEDDVQSEYDPEQFIVDENVSFSSNNWAVGSRPPTPPRGFCRICHEKNLEERNISPCLCRGTLSLVHKSCLEQWLVASDSNRCELCGHKFPVMRKPRYPLFKSLWIWLTDPNTVRDRGHFLKDMMNVILAAPFVLIMNHLTFVNMEDLDVLLEGYDGTTWHSVATNWLKAYAHGRILPCYFFWCFRKIKYHLLEWLTWHKRQADVTLLLSDNPPSVNG